MKFWDMDFRDILWGVENPFEEVQERPTRGTLPRATLGGKYNYLVKVYQKNLVMGTDLLDFGWQPSGGIFVEKGPDGYYVWVEPYLIVFGFCRETPERLSSYLQWIDYTEDQLQRASHGGKYQNLLKVIFAPRDREVYGDHLEFGFRDKKEYLGHANLPAGYWVWEWPHWFIFGEDTSKEETDEFALEEAYSLERLSRASLGGRFQTLKECFQFPSGKWQDSFLVLGFQEERHMDGFIVPRGYWVWYSPYLYIFERDLEEE